jgi:hypothetical protein
MRGCFGGNVDHVGLALSIKVGQSRIFYHIHSVVTKPLQLYVIIKTMFPNPKLWKSKFTAAGIHLGLSLGLAVLAALLVFYVWYPYPYRVISGGRELFLLVVAVDVILGPLITLSVFNPSKPRRLMRFDFAVIGLLQIAALCYGLWTVAVARPVHLAFEVYRFNVVHAIDVPTELLGKAPPELRQLPWTGPTLLSVREFKDNADKTDATMIALGGVALGAQPNLWQSYEKAKPQVIASAKPLAELKARFPARAQEIDAALKSVPSNTPVGYVPLVGRSTFWTVLINTNTAEVLAFVPLDPF